MGLLTKLKEVLQDHSTYSRLSTKVGNAAGRATGRLEGIINKFRKSRKPGREDKFMRDYLASDAYKAKRVQLDEKVNRLYRYEHDQELRKQVMPQILGANNFDYSKVDPAFSTVIVTQEALNKSNLIAKRIVRLAGEPLEVYTYSLDRKGDRYGPVAVRDVYIAKDQEVSPASCHVLDPINSALDIRNNYKMRSVGWTHSHGDFNPFFSPMDKDNIFRELEDTNIHKKIKVRLPSYGGQYDGVEYDVQYVTALVVNAHDARPFAAIAVQFTDLEGNKVFNINEGGLVNIIQETNGINMDPGVIDRQLVERVRYGGRPLQDKVGAKARKINTSASYNQRQESHP